MAHIFAVLRVSNATGGRQVEYPTGLHQWQATQTERYWEYRRVNNIDDSLAICYDSYLCNSHYMQYVAFDEANKAEAQALLSQWVADDHLALNCYFDHWLIRKVANEARAKKLPPKVEHCIIHNDSLTAEFRAWLYAESDNAIDQY